MKDFILDVIDFLRGEVVNDRCTAEQMQRIADFAKEELHCQATVDDLAEFYGQSRNNVSNIISRRPMPKDKKPQRRVLYDFGWFATLVPPSWRERRRKK